MQLVSQLSYNPTLEARIHANTLIPGTKKRKFAIDGTVGLIRAPEARDRILYAYPDTEVPSGMCDSLRILRSLCLTYNQQKFILMLRNPVIRAYSGNSNLVFLPIDFERN